MKKLLLLGIFASNLFGAASSTSSTGPEAEIAEFNNTPEDKKLNDLGGAFQYPKSSISTDADFEYLKELLVKDGLSANAAENITYLFESIHMGMQSNFEKIENAINELNESIRNGRNRGIKAKSFELK